MTESEKREIVEISNTPGSRYEILVDSISILFVDLFIIDERGIDAAAICEGWNDCTGQKPVLVIRSLRKEGDQWMFDHPAFSSEGIELKVLAPGSERSADWDRFLSGPDGSKITRLRAFQLVMNSLNLSKYFDVFSKDLTQKEKEKLIP